MSAEIFACEARRYGERHWCGRCLLAGADEPVCKTPAECGLGLSAIRDSALAEAERIGDSVDAAVAMAQRLIATGAVTVAAPDMVLLRRAAGLRAMVRLVERVMGDKTIVERLKSGGR